MAPNSASTGSIPTTLAPWLSVRNAFEAVEFYKSAFGATEVYRLDADGTILDASLVPPTAQNQDVIEEDLREVATAGLDLDEETLKARCEQTIRNHDPCISCAAHFLKLQVHRT